MRTVHISDKLVKAHRLAQWPPSLLLAQTPWQGSRKKQLARSGSAPFHPLTPGTRNRIPLLQGQGRIWPQHSPYKDSASSPAWGLQIGEAGGVRMRDGHSLCLTDRLMQEPLGCRGTTGEAGHVSESRFGASPLGSCAR